MLDVFTKNFTTKENIKLLFVGSPVVGQEHYLDEIRNSIEKNKINKQVKIFPFTKDLNAIWQISDIVVLPSTEAESFGLVAVEAMLAGKPVVASNHGGPTEIVVNEKTGYLVEPNNDKLFFDAIQKLIENPNLRIELGENGCQRAIQHFSVEQFVNGFEELFSTLISHKKTQS
jgi:glycosyltransferase involved in cell wall biosynthesis